LIFYLCHCRTRKNCAIITSESINLWVKNLKIHVHTWLFHAFFWGVLWGHKNSNLCHPPEIVSGLQFWGFQRTNNSKSFLHISLFNFNSTDVLLFILFWLKWNLENDSASQAPENIDSFFQNVRLRWNCRDSCSYDVLQSLTKKVRKCWSFGEKVGAILRIVLKLLKDWKRDSNFSKLANSFGFYIIWRSLGTQKAFCYSLASTLDFNIFCQKVLLHEQLDI
jgi:hypothetical protein